MAACRIVFLPGVALFKIIHTRFPQHLALKFRFSGQELSRFIPCIVDSFVN